MQICIGDYAGNSCRILRTEVSGISLNSNNHIEHGKMETLLLLILSVQVPMVRVTNYSRGVGASLTRLADPGNALLLRHLLNTSPGRCLSVVPSFFKDCAVSPFAGRTDLPDSPGVC